MICVPGIFRSVSGTLISIVTISNRHQCYGNLIQHFDNAHVVRGARNFEH